MKWMLKGSRVIGGMRAAHLKAPFSRAQAVLASDLHPDARLIVHRYLSSGEAEGSPVSEEDWKDLIATEEALELQSSLVTAIPFSTLWLVRSNFEEREAAMSKLRSCEGAIVHEEKHGNVYVLIVNESKGDAILDDWSRDTFDRAWQFAVEGNWQRSSVFAHLSWLLDIGAGLDRAALYALTLEKTSGRSAAEDIIAVETNSRSKEDSNSLRELFDRYSSQLCIRPVIQTGNTLSFARLEPRKEVISRWKREAPGKNNMFFPGSRQITSGAAQGMSH